jgi:membrane protein implicated in regulation of membrane protease activity
MEIINNYSMIWSGVIILVLAAYFLFRRGIKLQKGLVLIVIAAVLVGGWLVLRPQQASTTEMVQFEAEFGQGRFVLLELQSPY